MLPQELSISCGLTAPATFRSPILGAHGRPCRCHVHKIDACDERGNENSYREKRKYIGGLSVGLHLASQN